MMNFNDNPPEPRLLAQVYGDPHELYGVGDYLVDAVQECRSDNTNRILREPVQEGKVSIIQTKDGLAYSVSGDDLTEEEQQIYEEKSIPVPIDLLMKASGPEALLPDDSPIPTAADLRTASDELQAWAHQCESLNASSRITSSQQPDDAARGFDIVQKAKHYNSHPSGVECIVLAEKLSFNLGSAFKYVFRRDDKENCQLDLQKAKYYLTREIGRLQETVDTLPHNLLAVMYIHPLISGSDGVFVDRIVAAEENTWAARFYTSLFSNLPLIRGVADLRAADVYLQALIDEQNETAGDS